MYTQKLPKASLNPSPELAACLQAFALLFRRQTSYKLLERYITSLLTDLLRKN